MSATSPQPRAQGPELSWPVLLWWAPSLLFWAAAALRPPAGAAQWLAHAGVYAAFLAVFALSVTRWKVRPGISVGLYVLICLIGQLVPSGSGIFMYYAMARLGEFPQPRGRIAVAVGILSVAAVEAWALNRGWTAWALASLVLLITGGYSLFLATRRRADARLRLQQEEIERLARTAERERIARDLHDSIGHVLSLATVKLKLIDRMVDARPEQARHEIAELDKVLRDSLKDVRGLVHGYLDASVHDAAGHARIALEAIGVATRVDLAPARLDAASNRALGMVIKEAVTNIIRHANASQCALDLRPDGDFLVLEITDDGSSRIDGAGFGLNSMRLRIEELGGSLDVDPRASRLLVRLPKPGQVSAEAVTP